LGLKRCHFASHFLARATNAVTADESIRWSMVEVTIRKMREDDRPQIMRLLGHWNMAPRSPTPEVPDPERVTLIAENTFVAFAGNSLVGVGSYILHDDNFAETASLAVDPAWRGAGIGERLQFARLTEMKALGVKRIQTEADRPEVIDWYVRKFSYRVARRVPKKHDFSLANVDHWTVLELDLQTWPPLSEPCAGTHSPQK
jgi:3-keto-5-aminohexanoate cleavage enzyme